MKISRQAYADMFGPTVGDRVRLADTDLWLEVERDFTVYGEEVKVGGGKVIRDGMGQSQVPNGPGAMDAVDCVLTNALIIDHWGIVKADIGLKGQLVTDEHGNQVEGYQVHLGGALGLEAGFGRKVRGLKVTSAGLPDYVERLLTRYQADRTEGERFAQWTARATEEQLS